MSVDLLALLAIVLLALGFSFLCSVAEAVLLSITPSYIESLRDNNPERADMLKALRLDKVDQSLAAILTLNTIAHTVGAIVAGAQALVVFGSAWIGLFSAVMTLLILFCPRSCPRPSGPCTGRRSPGSPRSSSMRSSKSSIPLSGCPTG